MKIDKAVTQRIFELCIDKNYSINNLANQAAIPPSTIKNILYGHSRNIGIVTIQKICNGLDISIVEFFDDKNFKELEEEIE